MPVCNIRAIRDVQNFASNFTVFAFASLFSTIGGFFLGDSFADVTILFCSIGGNFVCNFFFAPFFYKT
jgi:hypothetical protein